MTEHEKARYRAGVLANLKAASIRPTKRYRDALAKFDPSDTRPQLAEFWTYYDAEYFRNGRL